MKPKKNPKVDLNRRWVLFLQIGLIFVLLFVLQLLNWKTYTATSEIISQVGVHQIEEEQPPVTIFKTPAPPPPPPSPQIFIVPDDEPVVEDEILSSELLLDDIFEPEEIIEAPTDDEPIEPQPFILIEDVPVFPGCEAFNTNEERKNCMSSEINKFVNKEFNTSLGQKLGLSGMNLVVVQFVINSQGRVEQIQTRAPHPELEKEAARVINKLPHMQPGKQRGKPVPVRYTIPIRFKVEN